METLEKWTTEAETFFNEKYKTILAHKGAKTNIELVEYNEALTAMDYLKMWQRKLKKMQNGKVMPDRVIAKINNLPDPKTTHPNMLRA